MKTDKIFTPITLTIETQAELDYLYALSQNNTTTTKLNAAELGFVISDEALNVQMPFYYAMVGARS